MTHHALHLGKSALSFALVLGSIFISSDAFATITLSSATNASNVVDITETQPTIYGGVGGDVTKGTCADKDDTATCNSCYNNLAGDDTRFQVCNTNRIYPSLPVTFNFSSDKVTSGRPIITDEDGSTKLDLEGTPSTVAKGATGSVTVLWSELCGEAGDSACDTDGEVDLRIGIDQNDNGELDDTDDDYKVITVHVFKGDTGQSIGGSDCDADFGICNFDISPGDGKVKVQDLRSDNGFPNSTIAIPFINVLFFLSKVGFSDISPASDYFALAVEKEDEDTDDDGTFSLESELITGLENETKYWFKTAVQDAAMNVRYFTPDTSSIDCFTTNPINDPPCHSAKPGEVLGILADDVNCFIATAAWGSPMAAQVNTFRKFRNTFLLPYSWGQKFVRTYYKYGPIAARFIAKNDSLRLGARVMLSPLLAFAWVSLKYGVIVAIFMAAFLIASPFAVLKFRRARLAKVRA